MTCEPVADPGQPPGAGPIAYTGLPLGLLLTAALVSLFAGGVLILLARRRRTALATALLILLGGVTMVTSSATPAQARSPDCPPAHNSLTIVQTSVMEGLAPGVGPVAITGIVTNNSSDNTDILAIQVDITGVSTDPSSAPGTCDASDYLLSGSRMAVGRTLAPGGSTTFSGAAIVFSNKSVNQDACQGATVQLLYTANPA